jgi:hypothetical protein
MLEGGTNRGPTSAAIGMLKADFCAQKFSLIARHLAFDLLLRCQPWPKETV